MDINRFLHLISFYHKTLKTYETIFLSLVWIKIDLEVAGVEEWNTYLYSYKNQGLYRKHGVDIIGRINWYGGQAGIYEIFVTPSGNYSTTFVPRWWHQMYKIPRKW